MSVTPYLATLAHYRAEYGRGPSAGCNRPNRAVIGAEGNRVQLTVPIVGGASAVKRLKPAEWIISEHGRWRHVHWGAIFSVYGKAPFFAHYAERLRAIIENEGLGRFADLTAAIDALLRDILEADKLLENEAVKDMTVKRAAAEMQARADAGMPLLHYVMNMGPQALFLLI